VPGTRASTLPALALSSDPLAPDVLPHRIVAILEVAACSDYLTQIALSVTLAVFGITPYAHGTLRVGYVVGLSLADTALLVGLIFFFLHAHGENPREVFFGRRPVIDEAARGIPLIFVAIAIGVIVLLSIRRFAPWLHTVEHNPLEDLLRTPRDAWLFALVVIVAGGVREELQRAFLLRRFEQWLGGGATGVVVTSIAFGAGHYQIQGLDAALATGLLGAFWGVMYLRRRSSVAPIVSHSGFDLVQILQFLVARGS
jgi:membrane protease YdiL (CAAX protease family)